MRNRCLAIVAVGMLIGGCQPKPQPATGPKLAEASLRDSSLRPEPTHRVEVMTRPNYEVAASLVGKKVRVQIRRDALGMAGNVPVGAESRWSSETSVSGTVAEVTDQWIVVDVPPSRRMLIPQASILMIEMTQ